MEVIEYSSSHKVLYSNSVILYDKDSDLEINVNVNEHFSFRLKVILDENQKGNISVKTDGETNTITFVTGKAHDTTGPAKPIEVATVSDKKIYFLYVAQKLYNGEYTRVDYTLFEG